MSHDGEDYTQIAFLRSDIDDSTGEYTERFEAGSFDMPAADALRFDLAVDLMDYFSGRTFEGDENWLVCPLELADSLASKGMLPKGAAVYSPDARGALRKRYDTSEFRQVRVAPAIELIWAMLRRKSSCETGAGFPV